MARSQSSERARAVPGARGGVTRESLAVAKRPPRTARGGRSGVVARPSAGWHRRAARLDGALEAGDDEHHPVAELLGLARGQAGLRDGQLRASRTWLDLPHLPDGAFG